MGKFSDAEDAYKHDIDCQPTDWFGHLVLGYFYVERGRLSEARTAFEAARSLTPDNEVVFTNLAALDLSEGKFQDAADLYSKSLKFEKGARSYASLGTAYYYQHRYPEAVQAFNESLKLNPSLYQAWGNLGSVYRQMPGQQAKAKDCFQKAIDLASKRLEIQPNDARLHANLAEYYVKIGEGQKALDHIKQIPDSSRSSYSDRIVLVYALTGDRSKALETLRTLPATDPSIGALKADPDLTSVWAEIKTRS
jgi:tetratricopeptide (TPR) repeat protein